MGMALKDASLKTTKALPNGAASVYSSAIDLGLGSFGDFLAEVEFKISAPAMATGVMGDSKTMKYDILHSDSSDLSSGATTLVTAAITQTGAGGAGCSAATYTFRLPVDCKRYVGIKATGSTTGDCSGSSLTFEALL